MVINKMHIDNRIIVPRILSKKCFIASDCELTEREVKWFNLAIQEVSEQILIDSTRDLDFDSLTGVNICFSLSGNIHYSEDILSGEHGVHFFTIVYLMGRLRQKQDDQFLFATYIEELVHHFWHIEDEAIVKYKVVEIAQKYDKNFTLDLYKKWGVKLE